MAAKSGDLRKALFLAIGATPDVLNLHAQATRWLRVPNSLAGLPTVLGNLPEILDTWTNPFGLNLSQEVSIRDWVTTMRRAESNLPFMVRVPKPKFVIEPITGKDAFKTPFRRGLMESHPQWIVMWHSSGTGGRDGNDIRRSKAYREIQGIYLAAYVKLAAQGRLLDSPVRWYEASLLLRILHQPILGDDLDTWAQRTRNVLNAYQYFSGLHDWLESPADEVERRRKQGYGALADILNEAFDLGRPSVFAEQMDGRRPIRYKRGSNAYTDLDLIFDDHRYFWMFLDDPLLRLGEIYGSVWVSAISPGKELSKDLHGYGTDPEEFRDYIGYSVPAEDLLDPPEEGTTQTGELARLSTLYIAASARHRYETMLAQRFISRLGRVRPRVLARIIQVLELLFAESRSIPEGASDELREELDVQSELVRLLAVSLATGSSPADTKEMVAIDDIRDLDKYYGLVYLTKEHVWYRPCLRPIRNQITGIRRGVLVETQEWTALSDVWSVGSMFPWPYGKRRIFQRPIETYQLQFAKLRHRFLEPWIDPVFCTFDGLGELVRGWFDGRDEGAQLRTAMIFGRRDPGAESHGYYTDFACSDLNRDYVEGMKQLWEQMLEEKLPTERRLFNLRERTSRIAMSMHCGDDWVPSQEIVRALMAEIKCGLRAAVNFSNPEGLNLATTYVGFVLALICGFRHVRTPIPDLRLISRRTGFMSLQEKDTVGSVHARGAYVPLVLRDQIDRFLGLLRYFWTTTSAYGTTDFKVQATKYRDRSRFDGDTFDLNLQYSLFYFEKNSATAKWYPSEMTGERLGKALNDLIPGSWPVANGGRHFVRTSLERLRCPATLINAHLGHNSRGESPWGPDSGFDPLHYRNAIAPLLDQILAEIDFEVMDFLELSRG